LKFPDREPILLSVKEIEGREIVSRPSPYSPEFREEAVQIALMGKAEDKPIAETARELNVHPETLRLWVRSYEREHGTNADAAALGTSERARLRELERRNRELEMENAFLKKAAAYFARDPR
jgi:transposase